MSDEGTALGAASGVAAAPPASPPPAAPPATPASPVAPPPAAEVELSKYVDPKTGAFLPGWKEALVDEKYRGNKFYDGNFFKDVKSLLHVAGNQSSMIGKKGIVPLSDKSTTTEVEEYRRAMGIPADATGYKYTPPQGIEIADMSAEAVKADLEVLNKAHFTQGQIDTAMSIYASKLQEIQKAVEENDRLESEEAERVIRAEAGADYDKRLHLANRIIEENTFNWPEQKKTALLEAINDSSLKPYVMDFLANIANKFVEHKVITDIESSMGPADIDAKIAEEMAKPAYLNERDPAHKLLVAQVQKLFQEKIARTPKR